MAFQLLVNRVSAQQLVASLPTEYKPGRVGKDKECCALHDAVSPESGGVGGCRDVSVGYHGSLRDLYQFGDVSCHAEVGQLVLDKALFCAVVRMSDAFFEGAVRRSATFQRRYMQCAPVGVECYGKGYCYLALIDVAVRSRVARCLGPFPLFADVFRFYCVCGIDGGALNARLDDCGGVWHVEAVKYEDGCHAALFSQMVRILGDDCAVRVGGMDEASVVAPGLELTDACGERVLVTVGEVRRFLSKVSGVGDDKGSMFVSASVNGSHLGFKRPYAQVVYKVRGSSLKEVFGGEHVAGLCGWLEQHGVPEVCGELLDDLCLAVTARALIPDELACLKSVVQTWAVLGDAVLKVQMAQYCAANSKSAEVCSQMGRLASNAELAMLMMRTGMRSHCLVGLLSETSKGNADMFEAVVGVMSLHCSAAVVRAFLESVGLLPVSDMSDRTFTYAEGAVETPPVVGLNSRQVDIVSKLAAAGLI